MTNETMQAPPAVEESGQANETMMPEMVLMIRDPDKGGLGLTRLMVPATEISNYQAAGWFQPEE